MTGSYKSLYAFKHFNSHLHLCFIKVIEDIVGKYVVIQKMMVPKLEFHCSSLVLTRDLKRDYQSSK